MKKRLNTEPIKNELEGSVFFPRVPQAPAAPLPQQTATESSSPKPASRPADLHANLQTGKPANVQAGKQVNLQTGEQVLIEKYSSYEDIRHLHGSKSPYHMSSL